MASDHRRRPRRARYGGVATFVVLLLPVIVIFGALALDLSRLSLVKVELQNTADAAAIAGASALLSARLEAPIDDARTRAQETAALNQADRTFVDDLDLNVGNDPTGDIVSGVWDPELGTFTPNDDPMVVNAMQVRAMRASSRNTPITPILAGLIGFGSLDMAVHAIALQGSPMYESAFPVALPDCAIVDSEGQPLCDGNITLDETVVDNFALTGLVDHTVDEMVIADLLDGYPATDWNLAIGSLIRINDTSPDDLEPQLTPWVNETVTMPVVHVEEGADCELRTDVDYKVVGFATLSITDISFGAPKQITGDLQCDQVSTHTATTAYFGLVGQPRLVE